MTRSHAVVGAVFLVANMRLPRCIDPANSFAVQPFALANRLVFDRVPDAGAVLQIIRPFTYVLVAACENLSSLTLHLPGQKVALISSLVGPDHHSLSLHLIALEFSLIELASFREVIFAAAMELSIEEVAFVESTIENEVTAASLSPVNEIANELDLVVIPRLSALPMLLVFHPLALIHTAIDIDKDAIAVSLSVLPLALINVTVGVCHSTFAVEQSILRLTVISGAVGKDDYADSLPNTLFV